VARSTGTGTGHVACRFVVTREQAEKAADLVLCVAAAGAVWYVLRTPRLRRIAWTLARTALTGTVPAWLGHELRRAWAESGTPRDMMSA
jgi:hypothetical protein